MASNSRRGNPGESMSSEEEVVSETATSKKRKEKKPVKEIPFADAVEQLNLVAEALPSVDEESAGRKRKKKIIKVVWEEVSAAIEKEAMTNGLSDDILVTIWTIVSHEDFYLPVKQASKLILSMIPTNKEISKEAILEIILHIPNFRDTIKLATLKYLNGIHDYQICDKASFHSYFIYSAIFFAGRTNELIPWICSLMKKLTTARIVQKGFINDLMDLLYTSITATSLKAIIDLLRYFKLLRPDLLPNNVFQMSCIGMYKKVELDEKFRTSLFNAKCRLGGLSESMNFDNNESEIKKTGTFLELVRQQCFPEFQLHFDLDPLPNDIGRLIQMNAYDIMRCSLKTFETLPLIINDPEVYQYFNSYISLVFQHRFDTYDPKEEQRYTFVLNRCVQLTTLLQSGIPAVNEWLLNFIRFWDGVIFKRYVFDLFRYISHIDFLHGYSFISRKFETLFLYGDALDRLSVWDTLTTLAMNWIDELQPTGEEKVIGSVESINEALIKILELIHNLVIGVASANGHKDEIFLINCCRAYIRMFDMMNDTPDQPTYILPPYALWIMVVLSDSLFAMDKFCELIVEIQPLVPVEHLRNTKHHEMLRNWRKDILPDVFRYFGVDPSGAPPFQALFENEFKERDPTTLEIEKGFGGKNTETQWKAMVNGLLQQLNHISVMNSTGLVEIMKGPDVRGKEFCNSIDRDKAKELAPNVINFVKMIENMNSGHN